MRRLLSIPLAILLSGITPAGSAQGAVLDIADVRGVPLASGGKAMLSYRATTDAGSGVALGTRFPGARIPRTAAFDGLWGDAGYAGAWLAPTGKIQFRPGSSFVESATFTNGFETDAVALGAGDRVEMAMASFGWSSPVPADRPRQAPDGSLAWDQAVEARTVGARYGAATGQMDALIVRADIVARGGDVDARGGSVSTPPLVIDLPRTYPKQTTGAYIVTNFFPYTNYISGVTMRVLPAAGKAVLTANVSGYVHEAREYVLPNGARMNEWHLPLTAVIMVSAIDDPAEARGAISMPAPGVAFAGSTTDAARRLAVPAGGTVVAGEGLVPQVLRAPLARGADQDAPADDAAGTTWLEDELRSASVVDRSLVEPVELAAGNGSYGFTVDPDFRGEGVLALRSLRRGSTGTEYAGAWSVPFVVLDGQPVKLTRARLTDLRVFAQYKWVTVGFTGYGGTTPVTKTRTLWGSAHQPGLVVDAVYDLGEGRHAFVNLLGAPEVGVPGSVRMQVTVRSLTGAQVDARPVQHVELPGGEVRYGEQVMTHGFSAPFDVSGDNATLSVGDRDLLAGISRTGYEGVISVQRAPTALSAAPQPDPAVELEGPLALTYVGPEGLPPGSAGFSTFRVSLLTDGSPPVPSPKPIGTPCGAPQATDVLVPDAPPALDVRTGWLDVDDANLYATVRVADLPTAAPQGTVLRWSLHWRHEHGSRFARAALTETGAWSFDFGGYNNGFFKTADVTGEVRTGADGLVRVVVPRSLVGYRNGELLRDTGAHSWIQANALSVRVDDAPQESDPTFGSGSDYTVGTCA